MLSKRTLKLLHLIGTLWFGVWTGFLLIQALRQAGVRWWVIFSLSGPSAVIGFILISIYLFAIYRSADRSQNILAEHPLTCRYYYSLFYYLTPLLGTFVSCLALYDQNDIYLFLNGLALGTLGTTFLVWVVLDPLIGEIESFTPQSRRLRHARLAQARAQREEKHRRRQQLLEQLEVAEQTRLMQWCDMLEPQARQLAELIQKKPELNYADNPAAVDLGLAAWRLGGMEAMQLLHRLTWEFFRNNPSIVEYDYLSCWWDGIGHWRHEPLRAVPS